MGGVDPLAGLSSGATFGEIKTLFGRVQNTADKRAEALFGDSGLASVYERIIWKEEEIFKSWLLGILQTTYPDLISLTSTSQLTDEICQQLWDLKGEGAIDLPKNPIGLVPGGDREIMWRYTREVFQNTTREELDRSIAARNEREDGLSQEWVLRKQYPNMTDQEIKNAMSGFSPRVVQNAAIGIQSTLNLFQQFMQLPDPEDASKPWAIRLGLPELLQQSMITLQREMAYGTPVYEEAEIPPMKLEDIFARLGTPMPVSQTGQFPESQNNSIAKQTNGIPISTDQSISPTDAVLASMGLPSTIPESAADRFYRSSDASSELRGRSATTEFSPISSPNPPTGTRLPVGLLGWSVPANLPPGYSFSGAPIGRVGDINPDILPIYDSELQSLLSNQLPADPEPAKQPRVKPKGTGSNPGKGASKRSR